MINYTERLTLLMQDIVSRVEPLSFIDLSNVLVFGRFGRSGREGPFATCHCLNLPDTEPGYYFWKDPATQTVTRRSEWFVTRSPIVTFKGHSIKYLISFTLPRFCDQSLNRSRKERYYRRATDGWISKLDTVIHELYHIAPDHNGIRRVDRADGICSTKSHSPRFFEDVARMVSDYLESRPAVAVYDFLKDDFDALETKYGEVAATCFRPFPRYPQRFHERVAPQPDIADPAVATVRVEPWRQKSIQAHYTADHLHERRFFRHHSRQLGRRRGDRAA